MTYRDARRLAAALKLLEHQVVEMISDKREDAGACALRAVVAPENQDAVADRELAQKLAAEADGCCEVLELIYAAMPGTPVHHVPRKVAR